MYWGQQLLRTLFFSYSEIVFLHSWVAGLALFLVTLMAPNVCLFGLLSVATAYFFAHLIGMQQAFLASGFFTYNALLVGFSIGHLFTLGPLSLFFLVTAAIFTFVLGVMLNHIFSTLFRLPILSIPFVIVSSLAYLASYSDSNLHVLQLYHHDDLFMIHLPVWLESFLRALGAIFFVPLPLAGACIAAIIFISSRILFFLALAGFFFGTSISGLMKGSFTHAYMEPNNFNYILIAMALGGVFLVPSLKSTLIAAFAVAVSSMLLDATNIFWARYGIPAFTFPFNIVTLTFLYVLGLVAFPYVARVVLRTPEETLDHFISDSSRFPGSLRKLHLPFSGGWTVWQGFSGLWTHKGVWQYAYDFVIEIQGKTFRSDGTRLNHYYAYQKPVLSPCRGRVIQVVNHLPDNAPGVVEAVSNWGNLVIIETGVGHYVELSHFAQNSILVAEGQWLEVGHRLGLCGNSGYSPQPHIHIQVQSTGQVGASTLPFSFVGYQCQKRFYGNDLPAEKSIVEPLYLLANLDFRSNFVVDQTFTYRVEKAGKSVGRVTFLVQVTETGETCFRTEKGKLFFAKGDLSFYFYRLVGHDPNLALLFAALPRLPLTFQLGMTWEDTPPIVVMDSVWENFWQKPFIQLLRMVKPSFGTVHYEGHFQSEGVVQALLYGPRGHPLHAQVVLHPEQGFSQLSLGDRVLILEEKT